MSDRIQKPKKQPKQPKPSTARKNKLLQVLLDSDLVEMPSYSNCEKKGLEFSVKNLERTRKQFYEYELALEKLEEERRIIDAKIKRIRKQKKNEVYGDIVLSPTTLEAIIQL
ncbi:hypothetical protein GE09DRAFT_1064401 [Coniochaeta sp. 2T2.1]|nr:hypothetical protein GE09DRAFT_1064401 [Coniochaeta sp. 2T2.1]